jgi:D-3-phosphoglycerate dehydrogenase
MISITDLKNKHLGRRAFCLGTAPHLAQLDLSLLRDEVVIGCNQLALQADERQIDYICFQRAARFEQVRPALHTTKHPVFVVPESVLRAQGAWTPPPGLDERLCPFNFRFATPGHSEFFSFDLANCIYGADSVAIEIQLAVWMGCNPIYIAGVDAEIRNPKKPFFDEGTPLSEQDQHVAKEYLHPELVEWFGLVRSLLWSKGIRLLNAGGEFSALQVLPKCRLRAAVGQPHIAVTSKTFSEDTYLVHELKRYFPNVRLNTGSGKLAHEKLIEFLSDADGMILGTEPYSADVIEALPCLRYVSKYGVGLNNIDFKSAKANDIEIAYRKGVNSDSVAELVLAFTLMLLRNMDASIQGYRTGKWRKLPGVELAETTVGLIGFGHVGKVVAAKFAALGVKRLLINDLLDFPTQPPYEFVPLDYLLAESNVVSLHVDAENRNHHLVNREFLGAMKPTAFLINTSRGEVVDEAALRDALLENRLAGAALDVYESEPVIDPSLAGCPRLLTTCHIAGSSNRAIKNMGWAAIEGLLNLFHISTTP